MLGLFFVIIFCGLPELWHKDKTKAETYLMDHREEVWERFEVL
jgi:hypothetical protein